MSPPGKLELKDILWIIKIAIVNRRRVRDNVCNVQVDSSGISFDTESISLR